MQGANAARATPSGRTVALFGGFLLLVALFVIAFFLLARAPHAGAQTTESPNGSDPPPASEAQGGDPGQGVAPDSSGPTLSVPAASLTVDSPLLDQVVTSETVTVQLPVPPVLPDLPSVSVSAPGVRVATGPQPPARISPPPPAPGSHSSDATASQPPIASTGNDESKPAGPSQLRAWTRSRAGSEPGLTTSAPFGGTRAPPWPGPPTVTASSVTGVSASAGNGLGNALPLLAFVAAGMLLVLAGGRRLRRQALGWIPAPWCALPERPG